MDSDPELLKWRVKWLRVKKITIQRVCLDCPFIEDITTFSAAEEEKLGMKFKDFLPVLFFKLVIVEKPISSRIKPEVALIWLMKDHGLQRCLQNRPVYLRRSVARLRLEKLSDRQMCKSKSVQRFVVYYQGGADIQNVWNGKILGLGWYCPRPCCDGHTGTCVFGAKKPSEDHIRNSTTTLIDLTDIFQDQSIHASERPGQSGKGIHQITLKFDTATVAQALNLHTYPEKPVIRWLHVTEESGRVHTFLRLC